MGLLLFNFLYGGGGEGMEKTGPLVHKPRLHFLSLVWQTEGGAGGGWGLSTSNNIDPEHYSVGEAFVSDICVGMNVRKLPTIL